VPWQRQLADLYFGQPTRSAIRFDGVGEIECRRLSRRHSPRKISRDLLAASPDDLVVDRVWCAVAAYLVAQLLRSAERIDPPSATAKPPATDSTKTRGKRRVRNCR